MLAVPVVLLLAGIGLVYLLFADRVRNELLSSSFLIALLVLDAGLLTR